MGSQTRHSTGFTLVELLIALAILGIIATFTIPKILNAQQSSQRLSVFKEAIAAMNEAMYADCSQGKVTDTNFGTFMLGKMNAIKVCTTNSIANGCWNTVSDPVGQGPESGVLMHSGAMIAGFDNAPGSPSTGADTLELDWNGLAGPNLEGQDIIVLRAYFDNTTAVDRVCTVRHDTGRAASRAIWNEIFD